MNLSFFLKLRFFKNSGLFVLGLFSAGFWFVKFTECLLYHFAVKRIVGFICINLLVLALFFRIYLLVFVYDLLVFLFCSIFLQNASWAWFF